MKKISRVRDLKKLIDDVILPGYQYKTNFNCAEFLVDINSKLIIFAKPVCNEDEFHYEFALDTQFLYEKQISYNEVVMVKSIIEILENNRRFVLSRLKKYTPDEYKAELKRRDEQSGVVFEMLQNFILEKGMA